MKTLNVFLAYYHLAAELAAMTLAGFQYEGEESEQWFHMPHLSVDDVWAHGSGEELEETLLRSREFCRSVDVTRRQILASCGRPAPRNRSAFGQGVVYDPSLEHRVEQSEEATGVPDKHYVWVGDVNNRLEMFEKREAESLVTNEGIIWLASNPYRDYPKTTGAGPKYLEETEHVVYVAGGGRVLGHGLGYDTTDSGGERDSSLGLPWSKVGFSGSHDTIGALGGLMLVGGIDKLQGAERVSYELRRASQVAERTSFTLSQRKRPLLEQVTRANEFVGKRARREGYILFTGTGVKLKVGIQDGDVSYASSPNLGELQVTYRMFAH